MEKLGVKSKPAQTTQQPDRAGVGSTGQKTVALAPEGKNHQAGTLTGLRLGGFGGPQPCNTLQQWLPVSLARLLAPFPRSGVELQVTRERQRTK